MITIAQVFKMFPLVKNSTAEPIRSNVSTKKTSIQNVFSKGLEEGCIAFSKEMGYRKNEKL